MRLANNHPTLYKWLKRLMFLIIVLLLIYHYFLYVDIKNGCYIKIKPSILEFSTPNIKKAIKILKNATPEEYQKVCANVITINPNLGCGGFNGGCFYTGTYNNPTEIHISTANKSYLGWTAAVIAHENCHLIQNKEKRAMDEGECYGLGDKILKQLTVY
jgi:hypothetical protein